MLLTKLNCTESRDQSRWSLVGLELGSLNLIAGKNSSGKTSAISRIILLSKSVLQQSAESPISFEAEFEDQDRLYQYKSSINAGDVTEELFFDGAAVGAGASPWAKLRSWAQDLKFMDFAALDRSQASVWFAEGEKSNPGKMEGRVLRICETIGLSFSKIGLDESGELYAVDHALQFAMPALSQGAYRALALAVRLASFPEESPPSALLIDDIGEGLDSDRSQGIARLLCGIDSFQVVMSTNDRYIMNLIPLEHWQILTRHGGDCHAVNIKNSSELFEGFRYTGLANVDILSSGFLDRQEGIL
jgi:energy-coupling factor transporter ATP-binding protein EcfA2